jgi:acetylornithine deacetylase
VRVTDTYDAAEVEKEVKVLIQDAVLPAMQMECPSAFVELVNTVRMPAFNANEDAELTAKVHSLCNDNAIDQKGGGKAGFFHEHADIPTVIVGPGTVQAPHMPSKYTQISMMDRCRDFVISLSQL